MLNSCPWKLLLGAFRIKDLAKSVDKDFSIPDFPYFDEVNECFDSFLLAEVIVEGLPVD